MPPTSNRYLVTGGAGFIGSHIVDALVERGDQVRVLDNLSSGSLTNISRSLGSIEFVKGSILDPVVVDEAAAGCAGVFHLAAAVSVQESIEEPVPVHETNALGTLLVLEGARKAGAKVVFSSSAAVYGDDPALPKLEDMATFPISPYGVQKLMGEHYVRNYGLLHGIGGVCLRYFNVYGPRQNPKSPYSGVISKFIDWAVAGSPLAIFGDGKQTRDFVYVGDVVRANLLAMSAAGPDCRVLNVGTGVETDLLELSKVIVNAAGTGATVRHEAARTGDILRSVCDPSGAQEAIGFRAERSLEAGLAETVRSFRA
jgi:UDP-glucose 4-epimerase